MTKFTPNHFGRIIAPVAVVALAVGVAACGSGEKFTGSGHVSAKTVKTLTNYMGSKPGKATGSPVNIGYMSQEGNLGFPQFTTQTEKAVAMVNNQLGGIDGHPMKLIECGVTSEEDGQACGQKFVNQKHLTAIIQGPLINGAAPFHALVDKAKIPVVSGFPLANEDASSLNSFYTTSGAFGTVPSYLAFTKKYLHAKRVAVVSLSGDPASAFVTKQIKFGFQVAGFKVTQANVAPNQTDVSGPLDAADARQADVFVPFVITPTGCLGMARSLQQANIGNKPIISLYACASPSVKKQLGDYPKWIYAAGNVSGITPGANAGEDRQLAAYHDWFTNMVSGNGRELEGTPTIQTVTTLIKYINLGGGAKATNASIIKAAKSFRGQIFLGAPDTDYGKYPGFPALPTLELRYYRYDGNGKFTDMTKGKWTTGPLVGDLL